MVKFTLNFNQEDFRSFRDFEKAMARQLGNTVYVGTDSCCLFFEYPPALHAMLRPYPNQKKQLEFELVSTKP